ncbi:hypothetical protein VN97_g7039 [Penicillium thymicola]|uniref:Uncharacterized protein n=1 Tax=Penicillium thymicola TaxID=293382 RepID=A0AAI9TFY8_PENTH|nr:hypothetical protein VN97_g7039 [Penicillium thymicola]
MEGVRGSTTQGRTAGSAPLGAKFTNPAASSSGDINNGSEGEEKSGGKPWWVHENEPFTFVDFAKLDFGGWTDEEVQMERCGQLSNSNQNLGEVYVVDVEVHGAMWNGYIVEEVKLQRLRKRLRNPTTLS